MVANLTQTLSLLITANHILDYYQVVTGFGHVSVRNPLNNATFFMTGNPPPALISSANDLNEYYVEDASPVNPNNSHQSQWSERFIHQGILKQFPSQQSVVHSHSRAVVPFAIAGVPFRPTYHMDGGFIGEDVPVFDIANYYLPNDTQNLLVNNERFGDALAKTFLTPAHNASTASIAEPDHYLVLQRGHGFAVLGTSIPEAVYRAVYTTWNADVQASALTINHAAKVNRGVKYLTAQEVSGTLMMDNADFSKEWPGKQTIEYSLPGSAALI
ncbi:MAG: hypothetical protein Q9195_000771 [Heterodermia aff. obscurata]